jgi:hypothetical protein
MMMMMITINMVPIDDDEKNHTYDYFIGYQINHSSNSFLEHGNDDES